MFRSRFSNAFPKSLPNFGPQDIERGITNGVPGEHIERLLCALLGLVLNRKKDVEYAKPSAYCDNYSTVKELEYETVWHKVGVLTILPS